MMDDFGLSEIAFHFETRGYQWKTKEGNLYTPTPEDISNLLKQAKERLDKEDEDDVQLEVGRLIIHKRDGHYDVYVHFGEIQ